MLREGIAMGLRQRQAPASQANRKPITRRFVLSGLAASTIAVQAGRAVAADPRPVQIGLTPVLLTSDLELLAALRSYLERIWSREVQILTRRTYQEITLLLVPIARRRIDGD